MKNFVNPFGVSMPVGTARDLRAAAVWPHAAAAAHAGASSVAARIAAQRKRRSAAATDASVNGGTV